MLSLFIASEQKRKKKSCATVNIRYIYFTIFTSDIFLFNTIQLYFLAYVVYFSLQIRESVTQLVKLYSFGRKKSDLKRIQEDENKNTCFLQSKIIKYCKTNICQFYYYLPPKCFFFLYFKVWIDVNSYNFRLIYYYALHLLH